MLLVIHKLKDRIRDVNPVYKGLMHVCACVCVCVCVCVRAHLCVCVII